MSAPFPLAVVQPHLDAKLGGGLTVCFLTGYYTLLLGQTIGPIVKEKRYILGAVLAILYVSNFINMVMEWSFIRQVFVVHDSTVQTMWGAFLETTTQLEVQDVALLISVFVADLLMAYRACFLWRGNLAVYALFCVLFLAELAVLPVFILQAFFQERHVVPQVSFLCIYLFISVGITTSATALLIYRIACADGTGRYRYIIEYVAQSGALYALTLLISSTLLAVRATHPANFPLVQATSYGGAVIPPITGISATLLATRILSRSQTAQITLPGHFSGLVFHEEPVSNISKTVDGSVLHLHNESHTEADASQTRLGSSITPEAYHKEV